MGMSLKHMNCLLVNVQEKLFLNGTTEKQDIKTPHNLVMIEW